MSLEEIRDKLINLYLCVKVRKTEDIKNITQESIDNERDELRRISVIDIINYIQDSMDILVEMKAIEKYEERMEREEEKNIFFNSEDPNDTNGLKLYEGMLIKAESQIRKHLRVRIIFLIITIYNIYRMNKN
jgi:hypothetical protein